MPPYSKYICAITATVHVLIMVATYSEASKEAVAHALRELEGQIHSLIDAISHEDVWIEGQGSRERDGMVRQACDALATIDYAMEDEVNSTVNCLAVIGVTPDTLKKAENVNKAKLALKSVCAFLKDVRVRVPIKGKSGTQAIPAIRVLLRSIQRSDLNLVAAYRKVPILAALPNSITYTVARTRPVRRKTVEEIFTLLSTRDGPKAATDRARLEALPRVEKHLALVRDHYTNVRANVRFVRLDARGRGRMQCAAELPLLFALRKKDPMPQVTLPLVPMSIDRTPRERARMIQATPYLETLPVYRYL